MTNFCPPRLIIPCTRPSCEVAPTVLLTLFTDLPSTFDGKSMQNLYVLDDHIYAAIMTQSAWT